MNIKETKDLIYVDGQSVVLMDGQTACVDLEYNENTDQFIITADCENWADDYLDFMRQYYPNETPDMNMIYSNQILHMHHYQQDKIHHPKFRHPKYLHYPFSQYIFYLRVHQIFAYLCQVIE